KNNGIHLGKGKGFDLRSYGTPIRRNTLSDFEKTLGIRFKGSALNTPDFVANTNKLFSLSGESRLVNISN
ncbi:hypothetical protein, partial [Leptotrichia sp. OH3620_COT-345]|uniref:hypothetical protein n=1 Tax=Leptotrichia sp. OH3620_COT-345 TaxID=2491048 RepID=UPI00131544DD